MGDTIFGLPQITEADYNQMMQKMRGFTAPFWKDANGNKEIEPDEIHSVNHSEYVTTDNKGKPSFTPQFESLYKEIYRQMKVAAELKLTYMEDVETNVESWIKQNTKATPADIQNYKSGTQELLKFAAIMKDLYQKQVGYTSGLKTEKGTENDQELINRYGHPWCIGDQDPYCVALPSIPARSSGVYLDGITCEAAGTLNNEPFSVVKKDFGGKIVSVPYATHFKAEQTVAAKHLDAAAEFFGKIENELDFTVHLQILSRALKSNQPFPYDAADDAWHDQGKSKSIFLFRAGADEVGGDGVGDPCVSKARFHFRLGFVNADASKLVEKYSGNLQGWEDGFAALIGNKDQYEAQKVVLNLPQFYDVIYENGDNVGGPNGTSIGQTLPHWCGADGKEEPCKRRIMIFVNKTERAYSDALMKQYILPLFDAGSQQYFKAKGVGLGSVVLHEIAHNFGPQQNKTIKGTSETFQARLKTWSTPMEELKAQTGAIYLGGVMLKEARAQFKAGKIDQAELDKAELEYKQHVLYDMSWAMRMILRATRGGKFEGGNYSKLAAVQIGILTEYKALTYDDKTKQWTIHFEDDKFLKAGEALMKTALKYYAEANYGKIEKLFLYYMKGKGFESLHADRINEVAGKMPSVLFNYKVDGLE